MGRLKVLLYGELAGELDVRKGNYPMKTHY